MKQANYDILYIGMALVDSIIKGFDPIPVSASGYRAVSGSLNVGGEAVNGAIAAAKLGLSTGILCALGQDAAGDMVVNALEQNGVDVQYVIRSREHPTPVTTMFVREDGTRRSVTNQAHAYNFHPEQYTDCFASAQAISIGSLFRAPFDDPEIIYRVVTAAKQHSAIVFADTKLPNFRKLALADIREALPLIDYIFPNEDEAGYFSGRDDPDGMADVFLDLGVKNVIIKLGAKGCVLKNAGERIHLDAHDINAVDATGAGDNFGAGFASELLRGGNHASALRFANACGAICTSAVGASDGLKSRDQVLKYLGLSR